MRFIFSIVLATLLASFSLPALAARETRVAALDLDAGLTSAIAVALSPWGLHVVSVSASPPEAELALASAKARALAREQDAGAVLWIARTPEGQASLWLYDAQTEQVTVRPLSRPPPFDEAEAAAVALSVKTLLRATTVAPPHERTSAEAAPPPAPPSAPARATTPSPKSAPGLAPPAAAPNAAPSSPALPPTTSAHAFRLEAAILGRAPTGGDVPLGLCFGVGLSFWPAAWREHVGVGLDARLGPGVDLTTAAFSGRFSDTVVGASARGRVGRGAFSLELAAGPSLHVTSLSGTVLPTGQAASVGRADPSIDLAVAPGYTIGTRLRLGLLLGSSVLLRYQQYTLRDEAVLKMPPIGFHFGGRASLALD